MYRIYEQALIQLSLSGAWDPPRFAKRHYNDAVVRFCMDRLWSRGYNAGFRAGEHSFAALREFSASVRKV